MRLLEIWSLVAFVLVVFLLALVQAKFMRAVATLIKMSRECMFPPVRWDDLSLRFSLDLCQKNLFLTKGPVYEASEFTDELKR